MKNKSSSTLYLNWTWKYILAWMVFRFVFAGIIELSGDEAYYWLWSKHPAWCYFSKGPAVSWTIWLGTHLLGDTVLGIRFFSVLLSGATSWIIFLITRELFSEREGFWTVVILSLAPMFFAGGMLMTIDPISVFFWAAAYFTFLKATRKNLLFHWAATGLLVSAGILAKYTNIALLPSFALYCAWSPETRKNFKQSGFWIMVFCSLLSFLPLIYWNSQHDWVTFHHLLDRGQLDEPWQWSIHEFTGFLGEQLAVVQPFFFIGLVVALFRKETRASHPDAYRFLASGFAPLFLFYSLLAWNDSGQPNWTAPAYVTGMILMTATWTQWTEKNKTAKRLAQISIAISALIICAFTLSTPFRLPTQRDPLKRVRGWKHLAEYLHQRIDRHKTDFIISDSYQTASLMAFYISPRPAVYIPHADHIQNQFSFWPGYEQEETKSDALYITRKTDRVPHVLYDDFSEVIPLGKHTSMFRNKHPVEQFYIYLCRSYQGGTP